MFCGIRSIVGYSRGEPTDTPFGRKKKRVAMSSAELPARQSQKVAVDLSASDGDTWHERIAVCESATKEGKPKLLLRSYYRNSRTNEKAWDEPPSGASQIKHATPDMRQKAELQMQELQLTLELIPDDTDAGATTTSDGADKKNKAKGGLFGRFRGNRTGKKKEKVYLSESKDLNLQKAIARSMADQRGSGAGDEPVVYYDPEANGTDHDEALEMAKALSMSEAGGAGNMTEDEMLQQALEASRLDAAGSAPKAPPGAQDSVPKEPKEDMDKKMPAKSDFDPYAS